LLSPPTESSRAEVNTTRCLGVPNASNAPYTCTVAPGPNLTTVPGNNVNDTPANTSSSPDTT
jgi:hypothetical protein